MRETGPVLVELAGLQLEGFEKKKKRGEESGQDSPQRVGVGDGQQVGVCDH